MDEQKRSIAKGVSWRIVATIATTIVIYIVTRDLTISLGAGIIDAIFKFLLYYFHERAWYILGQIVTYINCELIE